MPTKLLVRLAATGLNVANLAKISAYFGLLCAQVPLQDVLRVILGLCSLEYFRNDEKYSSEHDPKGTFD